MPSKTHTAQMPGATLRPWSRPYDPAQSVHQWKGACAPGASCHTVRLPRWPYCSGSSLALCSTYRALTVTTCPRHLPLFCGVLYPKLPYPTILKPHPRNLKPNCMWVDSLRAKTSSLQANTATPGDFCVGRLVGGGLQKSGNPVKTVFLTHHCRSWCCDRPSTPARRLRQSSGWAGDMEP